MYYFTLCDYYYNYKVINFFIDLLDKHPEYFKLENLCFAYYQGSFSYNYFNGEYNSNEGPITLTLDYEPTAAKLNQKPIRFSMSNIFVEENDLYNRQFNTLLKYFDSRGHAIEITNFDLMIYIKNNYNYDFILSNNIFLTLPFTALTVEKLIENNNNIFSLIQIPNNFNETELKNIKHKRILEIVINSLCENCKNYENCLSQEQKYQINYSEKTTFKKCVNFKEVLMPIEKVKDYYKMGINHFIIKSNPQHKSIQYLYLLIDYFIKNEFKYKTLIGWNNYD